MAPGHHLLFLTFGLWGLLLLLHVDSVHTLIRCMNCSQYDPPGCGPDNTNEQLCAANEICATTVWFYYENETTIAARGCRTRRIIECDRNPSVTKQGIYFCYTDRCNNQDNSSFNREMTADTACIFKGG